MSRVWGPPSRCVRCGAFGRFVDGPQERCDECGEPLAPRPFFDMALDEPRLAPPPLCGTALLSMGRIGEIQRLAAAASIEVSVDGDACQVVVTPPPSWSEDPTLDAAARLTLPAELVLGLRPVTAPHGGARALVRLAPGVASSIRFAGVGAGPWVVTLHFADALADVERSAGAT